MSVEPISSKFEKLYAKGKPQVVWNTLIADLETPVSVMLKLANNKPNSFLLTILFSVTETSLKFFAFLEDLISC